MPGFCTHAVSTEPNVALCPTLAELCTTRGWADLGPIPNNGPNHIHRVLTSTGPGVLKVYGALMGREADLLNIWDSAGLPVCSVLAAGTSPQFILTSEVPGTPVTDSNRAPVVRNGAALAVALADAGPAVFAGATPISDRIATQQEAVVTDLAGDRWVEWSPLLVEAHELVQAQAAADLAAGRFKVIHGDLAPRNTIASVQGHLVAIDPHGLLGPVEWDVASFIGRADPDDGVAHLYDVADALELDPVRLAVYVAWHRIHWAARVAFRIDRPHNGPEKVLALLQDADRALAVVRAAGRVAADLHSSVL